MLGWWMTGQAVAGAVLVYGGDVGPDYRAALRDSGLDPWELDARAPGELAPGRGPSIWAPLGAGLAQLAPPRCDAEVQNADLRESVSVAEGHLNYRRLPEARRVLESVEQRLPCLREPAEASLAGRVAFLRGVVAALGGDDPAATRAFAEALAWQPDLRWNDEFDPSTRRGFDAARAQPAGGAALVLGPGAGDGGSLWIDGRRPAVSDGRVALAPGRHLVQVLDADRTWTLPVDLGATPLVLANPAGLTAAELRRLTTLDDGAAFAPVLVALAAPERLYMRVDGTTWEVGPAGLSALPSRASGDAPLCSVGRRCVGLGMTVGGATALVSGVGVYAWSFRLQSAHADDTTTFEAIAPGTEGASELVAAYDLDLRAAQAERARMMWAGGGLAGAGLLSLLGGVVLSQPRGADTTAQGPSMSIGLAPGGAVVGVGAAW